MKAVFYFGGTETKKFFYLRIYFFNAGNNALRKEDEMRFLKLLCVTVAAGALITTLAWLPDGLCFKGGESYTFFCGDTSKNCKEVTFDNPTVASLGRLTLNDVCGECAFYNEFDLDNYLKSVNGEIVFVEELSDSVNYYCKADLPYSVILYGEEINLHVSIKDDGVKAASPIIFGGY